MSADVGVYVHVPFCERVCPYCDFAVVATPRLAPALEDRYRAALLRELERRRPGFGGRALASLYFGGGTPSLLRPDTVARLVEAVRAAFPPPPGSAGESGGDTGAQSGDAPEVTLEVNPSTLERERLPAFHAAGVDRVSVGIQSFDDATLKRLGRAHRGEEGHRTLRACREAGFANLSLDLIVAAPGQTRASLEADLDAVLGFGPEHVSAYELTVEPGTPFARARTRGQLALPDEDTAIALLGRVEERLEAAGLRRYEISSYARPGRESVHNRRYWERRPVLGLGMGAVSSDPPAQDAPFGARVHNPRSLGTYLGLLEPEPGRPAQGVAATREPLDAKTARGEAVFLALRQLRGLDATRFAEEFGAAPRAWFGDAIDRLTRGGLLDEDAAGGLALTPRGRLLSDGVFAEFV